MRNWLSLSLLAGLLVLGACNNENKDKKELSTDIIQNGKTPKMAFDTASHDFGTITQGEIVSWTFDFTNTGDGDLLITDAQTSCGCTVPEYPKEPVHPGDKGSIKVKFNSEGKEGEQKKRITIFANTNPNRNYLDITANVVKAPAK